MPRVSYDYTSLRPNSRSPWMYFSTILSGSKPGLWQVVVTFFFSCLTIFTTTQRYSRCTFFTFFIILTFFTTTTCSSLLYGWWHGFKFLIICICDMFFPRRSCGGVCGIPTVTLQIDSRKRFVRGRNHRWSWTISRFGTDFGTAFSEQPV